MSEELVISGNLYNRGYSYASKGLASILAKRYNVRKGYITSSGLNAISILMNTLIMTHKKVNIITSMDMYYESLLLFVQLTKIYPELTIDYCDIFNNNELLNVMGTHKEDINILYIESSTVENIFDYSIINDLRNLCQMFYLVVDNTFLTDVILNPFEYNADFVILSLTKYYSGGTAIAGAILGNQLQLMEKIIKWAKVNGNHVSPYNCKLIMKEIPNIEKHIHKTSVITKGLIELLENKGIVSCMISDTPRIKYFNDRLYPSVIKLTLPRKKRYIKRILKSIDIKISPSFGAANSKIDNYFHQQEINGKWYTTIRISIGYNDTYERLSQELLSLVSKMGEN